MRRWPRLPLVAIASALSVVVGSAVNGPSSVAVPAPARPVTAIAIVADDAINPLHADFRTADGRDPAYPAGMPAPVRVALPRTGNFDDAMGELAAGPLGNPKPGTLYAVAGTRLLIYATPGVGGLLAPGPGRAHGTATASSAAGRATGTSPDSLIVFVPGDGDPAYEWLAHQRWIDVASTSEYAIPTTNQCAGAQAARALHADGGLLFSSSGNTYDYYEAASTPNGLPEVFQVGGTDASGATWLPGHPDEPSPFFAFGTVVRPYEVGARFSFAAASGDSFSGTQPFGGTSGAAPTVAGYAAELIATARRTLGHSGARTDTAMAKRGSPTAVVGGPLADGVFTRDELVDVLHRTATPHEPASAARYALEGYGEAGARSQALALRVLRGQAALPERSDEDSANASAESVRAAQASRC